MAKFEYKIVTSNGSDEEDEAMLNDLGRQLRKLRNLYLELRDAP